MRGAYDMLHVEFLDAQGRPQAMNITTTWSPVNFAERQEKWRLMRRALEQIGWTITDVAFSTGATEEL